MSRASRPEPPVPAVPASGSPEWRPSAACEVLRARAALLARVRAFFAERGVLEVETPVLAAATVSDPQLHSMSTTFTGPGAPAGRRLYLQTSPEFAMKRLLAAGSGPIYQIARAFRDGEAGRRHNPEFTLLEWYRPGFDHHAMMDEVEALVSGLLGLERRAERLPYAEVFRRHLGLDAHAASEEALRARARRAGIATGDGLRGRAAWRDLLMSHLVEPALGVERPLFVYDYPADLAALARLRPGTPPVAERFELYIGGVELANGYHELGDAGEQRARIERDRRCRREAGLADVAPDERLLAALDHGLPSCAGVALGVDRLVMLALGATAIDEVIAFPVDRA